QNINQSINQSITLHLLSILLILPANFLLPVLDAAKLELDHGKNELYSLSTLIYSPENVSIDLRALLHAQKHLLQARKLFDLFFLQKQCRHLLLYPKLLLNNLLNNLRQSRVLYLRSNGSIFRTSTKL
ncbi:hypothetical protein B0O99DRAFT_646259, partial [Bisporella sp. PMI_857]